MSRKLVLCIGAVSLLNSCVVDNRVRDSIYAALGHENHEVRALMVRLLGSAGDWTDRDVILPLLNDPSPLVRRYAIGTCGTLGWKDMRSSIVPLLGDPDRNVVVAAYSALTTLGIDGIEHSVASIIRRTPVPEWDWPQQIRLLASASELPEEFDFSSMFQQRWESVQSSATRRGLARSLSRLPDVPDVALFLRRVLNHSPEPMVRHHAASALLARGAVSRDEVREHLIEDWVGEEYYREGESAWQNVRWIERTFDEVASALGAHDLVYFGEMHGTEWINALAIRIARRLGRGDRRWALGYEPSVKSAQQPVLDATASLGWKLVPLERDWRRNWNGDVRLMSARDHDAARTVRAYFDNEAKAGMFVIYGATHCLGDGHIPDLVDLPHAVVLCVPSLVPPVSKWSRDFRFKGRCFELGENLYAIIPSDPDFSAPWGRRALRVLRSLTR